MPGTAMLLAAGRGERMGPLTASRPKPLLSVGEETLIERHLRRLAHAGVEQVVINLSYRGDDVRALVGETSAWGQTIVYSDEGEPPLETAGGIIQALPLLGSAPFILASADIVTDFDFRALAGARTGCLVLVPNPAHHPDGDFGLAPGGELTPPTAAPDLQWHRAARFNAVRRASPGRAAAAPGVRCGHRPGAAARHPLRGSVAGCRHAAAPGRGARCARLRRPGRCGRGRGAAGPLSAVASRRWPP